MDLRSYIYGSLGIMDLRLYIWIQICDIKYSVSFPRLFAKAYCHVPPLRLHYYGTLLWQSSPPSRTATIQLNVAALHFLVYAFNAR